MTTSELSDYQNNIIRDVQSSVTGRVPVSWEDARRLLYIIEELKGRIDAHSSANAVMMRFGPELDAVEMNRGMADDPTADQQAWSDAETEAFSQLGRAVHHWLTGLTTPAAKQPDTAPTANRVTLTDAQAEASAAFGANLPRTKAVKLTTAQRKALELIKFNPVSFRSLGITWGTIRVLVNKRLIYTSIPNSEFYHITVEGRAALESGGGQ